MRSRGDRYVVEGRVTLAGGSDELVKARVWGTREYHVVLAYEQDRLFAECSCPHFEMGNPCKHVWATLRAADDAGRLSAARRGRVTLVLGARGEAGDVEEGARPAAASPPDALRGRFAAAGAAGAAPGRRGPRAPRIAWSRAFEHVKEAVQAAERPRRHSVEMGYLLSAPLESAGDLVISVVERSRLKDGSKRAPKPIQVTHALLDREADPVQRRILAVLLGCSARNPSWGPASLVLGASLREVLLPILCRTGACFLWRSSEPSIQLSWDAGEPWELCLVVDRAEDDAHWEMRGELRRGEESMDVGTPELVLPGGHVFRAGRVSPLRDFDAFAWVDLLRQQGSLRIPASQEDALLENLFSLPRKPLLDLPPSLRLEEIALAPRPTLQFEPTAKRARGGGPLLARAGFDYGDLHVDEDDLGEHLLDLPQRRVLRRDRAAEAEALGLLQRLGFRDAELGDAREKPAPRHALPAPLFPAAIRALVQAGWTVESDGKRHRLGRVPSLRIHAGADGFDLEGTFDFDGLAAPARDVLAALKRGEGTVALGDGILGVLPEVWIQRYGVLAHLGEAPSEDARRVQPELPALRFARSQVALVDALIEGQPEIAVDERFTRLRDELLRFDGIAPARVSRRFHGRLRPYQRVGLAWLQFLQRFGLGGCLADDMGLGKTVQVLALLVARKAQRGRGAAERRRPSLVVAPCSVVFNWRDEAARFAPSLDVLKHTGADRLPPGDHFDEHDIILTTYGTLRREADLLAARRFDYVILDEAQAIKNASTAVARAARLLQAEHRLALSGTPIENHLGEIWSLFEFLNPSMLGKGSAFKLGGAQVLSADDPAAAVLARAIRPFLLRRTKAQVAPDLPEKQENTLYCEMERPQHEFYERLRRYYQDALLPRVRTEGIARSTLHVLEALLRLRQAACHPGLVDPDRKTAASAKLDALMEHLDVLLGEGHKALVFSQFTSLLALLEERLRAAGITYEYLDGDTSRREERVARFQTDPACPVFLISLKAGGTGLNLTAADYVFLLDPWWNPAVEAQAIDRAHRIGQARPVIAYRLLCKGTVEEKIAALQQEKRALADSLIHADEGLARSLTQEDLEKLLS